MATGGLLHHHHQHPCSAWKRSQHLFCRRAAMNRIPFLRKPSTTLYQLGHLWRPIQSVKQEEQVGRDGEAMEWVNKAPHDPMVEVDPVTVFRRIVIERRASLAKARAKEEQANLALQTNTTPPFVLGLNWPCKPAIAIIGALVLLAVAAALYFLRSRKDSADPENTVDSSVNGRRKLLKDTMKAPESIHTAMTLGAASVSRPKVHTGSVHETLCLSNGNVVESQCPKASTGFYQTANMVATDDMQYDVHAKPFSGKTIYSSSIVEDYIPLDVGNVGVDVAEGPWFGQGVTDIEMLAPTEVQEHDSEKSEEPDTDEGFPKSQALPISNETESLPAEELLSGEISVDEIGYQSPVSTDMVDGKFHGDVVAASKQLNRNNTQVPKFISEELEINDALAESSTTTEKFETILEEGLMTPLEDKRAAYDTVCSEQNVVIGSPALDLSNGQLDETDSESNNDQDSVTHNGVEQFSTLNQDVGGMSLDSIHSKNGFEEERVADGSLLSLNSEPLNSNKQENIINSPSGVDETLEGIIETKLDKVLGDVSSSVSTFQIGKIEEDEGFVCDPRKEQATDSSVALRASEEDRRQESKKALEAALPAIAIGVGSVGALFGVAGGLQVVGFAAVASFLSHDFLWAQNRESLRQELNGVTDRQKLVDFLAKRNIMRMER